MDTTAGMTAPSRGSDGRAAETGVARERGAGGLLAGMRIRKKLIFLHTIFSLVLAGILGLALRPAIREVVREGELHEARVVMGLVLAEGVNEAALGGEGVTVRRGTAAELGLATDIATRAAATPGEPLEAEPGSEPPRLAAFDAAAGEYVVVEARLNEARGAVVRLYGLLTLALLAVYGLVAAALELFVLPQHVYEPIRIMQEADRAVQEGRREAELIPESVMPRDELGEIMRSRNASIVALRQHERDLAETLRRLEQVAADLARKNHLLETARKNLADADRLASLGMLAAGLSHEMNTPLAVLKGLAEKLAKGRGSGLNVSEAELMVRVVGRLEKLSESLLDFARVRPAKGAPAELRPLIEEAWTLVSLDREAKGVAFENRVPAGTAVECEADRMVQVLVNLLRNAVDAVEGAMAAGTGAKARGHEGTKGADGQRGRIVVDCERLERDGRRWVSVTITDNGPGIDPEVLKRLFEPFVSTRLDSRGTGLGLAVAEGIVREHDGLLLARNREDEPGAVFEVVLPEAPPPFGEDGRGGAGGS